MTIATEARKALNLSTHELALLVSESDFTVRTWEEDDRNMSGSQQVLCRLLCDTPRIAQYILNQHMASFPDARAEEMIVLCRKVQGM